MLSEQNEFSIRLYLDGLDELPSVERQQQIVSFAKDAWDLYPGRISVILTGREHISGEWLNWLIRIRLSDFDQARISALASRWLEDDRKVAEFFDELNGTPKLTPLLGTPLLCALTLSTYRALHRLPENRIKLYDMFVSLLCGGLGGCCKRCESRL